MSTLRIQLLSSALKSLDSNSSLLQLRQISVPWKETTKTVLVARRTAKTARINWVQESKNLPVKSMLPLRPKSHSSNRSKLWHPNKVTQSKALKANLPPRTMRSTKRTPGSTNSRQAWVLSKTRLMTWPPSLPSATKRVLAWPTTTPLWIRNCKKSRTKPLAWRRSSMRLLPTLPTKLLSSTLRLLLLEVTWVPPRMLSLQHKLIMKAAMAVSKLAKTTNRNWLVKSKDFLVKLLLWLRQNSPSRAKSVLWPRTLLLKSKTLKPKLPLRTQPSLRRMLRLPNLR